MRTILLASVVASLVALTVACGEEPVDQLEQADGTIAGPVSKDEDVTEPAPAKTTPKSTTEAPKTTTTTTTTQQTPAKADPKTCDPGTAKTKKDCATCCAQKAPAKVVDSCACGAAGKCTTACEQNVCKGGLPDIQCGICLLKEGCDLGENLQDIGTESGACLAQCAGKPD